MIKISKMADYGVLTMSHMARQPHALYTAGQLAETTDLNLPTVTKVLKALSRSGVLVSSRGVGGGYALARAATCITLADIVEAIDGPVKLTACAHEPKNCSACRLHDNCSLQDCWYRLNTKVRDALASVSLMELATTAKPAGGKAA